MYPLFACLNFNSWLDNLQAFLIIAWFRYGPAGGCSDVGIKKRFCRIVIFGLGTLNPRTCRINTFTSFLFWRWDVANPRTIMPKVYNFSAVRFSQSEWNILVDIMDMDWTSAALLRFSLPLSTCLARRMHSHQNSQSLFLTSVWRDVIKTSYFSFFSQGATVPFISPWPMKLLMPGEDLQLHIPATSFISFSAMGRGSTQEPPSRSISFIVSVLFPQSGFFENDFFMHFETRHYTPFLTHLL